MVVILYSSIIRDLIFNKQYYTDNNIPYIHWSFNNSKHDKQRDVTFIEIVCFLLCLCFIVVGLFVLGGLFVYWWFLLLFFYKISCASWLMVKSFQLHKAYFLLNSFFPYKIAFLMSLTDLKGKRQIFHKYICVDVYVRRHTCMCVKIQIYIWEGRRWSCGVKRICTLAVEQASVTLSHLVPKQPPVSC